VKEKPNLVPVQDRPVFALSLLQEISQAISHLSADRALMFLIESTVSVTEAGGALLLIPHEKLSEMVPLIENLPPGLGRKDWPSSFFAACFRLFLEGELVPLPLESPLRADLQLDASIGTALANPVLLGGKPVALLFLFRGAEEGDFSEEQLRFLEIFTPFLGALLENFRLHNEVIHKDSRLSALYEISQRAESLIDFRDIYDALYHVVKNYISFDVYHLYLLDAKSETLETHRASQEKTFPARLKLGEGAIGLAASTRKPHLTFNEQFNSVLILPIIVSGKLVGVLTIASRKSYAYRDEDIIGLRIISTQIASIDQIFRDLLRLRGMTQHILQGMPAGVLIFDNTGHISYANPEMTKILARPVPVGWSPDSGEELPGPLTQVIRKVLESELTLENTKIKLEKLTPPRILDVAAFPFLDEEGQLQGTAFFLKDITQISRLEDQLKRADRLSALGVLAAGIAHEIRNPLTGMKMIVQLLHSEFPETDSRREPLNIIQKEIDRLEKIIVNLLDFARPTKPKAESLSLIEVLNACLLLLQNQMNKVGIRLACRFPEAPPPLMGDSNQLKQVFLNILTNAMQAMPHGGDLLVAVEIRDQWMMAQVRDSGLGIPHERLKAIFDPFMTTKEDGTGLGLPLALRIVEEHGGRIEVDSDPGVGSTFTIWFPLRDRAEHDEIGADGHSAGSRTDSGPADAGEDFEGSPPPETSGPIDSPEPGFSGNP
jgi:two-component system, NtrC family, nitrogen regulation sensor histidine kinase GlnL